MEDVTNTVRPYQVFTALLTQSGGENIQYYDEGAITIGVTYLITANNPGEFGEGDFTNVGAPNNLVGTSFIATGTTPNSWGTFSELEYNTGAPVATVLENTIGNVWFTYLNNGTYIISSNDLFTENKTITFTTTSSSPVEPYWITTQYVGTQEIYLVQFNIDGEYYNNLPLPTPIEIRVYN
jgi:hypothetical protein